MKQNSKLKYHLLFWLFIGLYLFDYFIDETELLLAIGLTTFELFIFSLEFYVNLFILLPILLKNKGKLLYFISIILLFANSYFIYYLTGLRTDLLGDTFSRSIISFTLNHSLFIVISYLVWHFLRFEEEKEKRWIAEKEKLKIEMQFLKAQISPHFLFNTLNNIYALSLTKDDNAPKLIELLSEMMRYYLYKGSDKLIPLKNEIDLINKYIEIQTIREVAGKKNIIFDSENVQLDQMIPPLLLITLIENAFKHGDINEQKEGYVHIYLSTSPGQTFFHVQNSYLPSQNEAGIGLKNLKAQLFFLFGENYDLDTKITENCYSTSLTFNGGK